MMTKIRIATWNLKWADPKTDRGLACEDKLKQLDADFICLTEAFENSFATFGGHSVGSDPDYGYTLRPNRRKVVIWSRWPFASVDRLGSEHLPSGRYVAATIDSPIPLELIGVCIPWKCAHVNGGRRDRGEWEDHVRFLSGLSTMNGFVDGDAISVVLGDFNQRMTGKYVRRNVSEKLKDVFRSFEITTAELRDAEDKAGIDHIAIRGTSATTAKGIISRFDVDGNELSDHFGVWCDVMVGSK